MPILLQDYLIKVQKNSEMTSLMKGLISDLNINPPIKIPDVKPEFRYANYADKDAMKRANRLVKGILDHLFSENYNLVPILKKIISNLLEQPPSIATANKIHKARTRFLLVANALRFGFLKVGNCSERAAYSALRLYEILFNTDMDIILQALTKRDHVVVMLGNKDQGYYIYDPLINPEIVTPFTEYQTECLQAFPIIRETELKVIIKVSAKERSLYIQSVQPALSYIRTVLHSISAQDLWGSPEFQAILVNHSYSQDVLKKAYEVIEELISSQISASYSYT